MNRTIGIREASRRGLGLRHVQPRADMDALIEGFAWAAERLLTGRGPRQEAQESFDRFAVAILKSGNGLPAMSVLIDAGVTSTMVFNGLVERGALVRERSTHFIRVLDPARAVERPSQPAQIDQLNLRRSPPRGLTIRAALARMRGAGDFSR